ALALRSALRHGPQLGEVLGLAAAALEARAMAGGKRRGFIQEEQLGVAVGLHHLALAALELEHAGDPLPAGPAPGPGCRVGQMNHPAAIAHHEAAVRGGNDIALGRDTVLERHEADSSLKTWHEVGGSLESPRLCQLPEDVWVWNRCPRDGHPPI